MDTTDAIAVLLLTYSFFLLSLGIFVFHVRKMLSIRKVNNVIRKEIARKTKLMEDMRARGDLNEWMMVQTTSNGEIHNLHICQKTGWCPEKQLFFTDEYVKSEMIKVEYKKQYEEYRNSEVSRLATKYHHSLEAMEEIVENVFDIKKQFALLWIKEKNTEVRVEKER